MTQSYMKTVYQMFIRCIWNSRDDRLTKKASMTRDFWNVKEGFKLSRGASFQVVKFQQ